MTIEKTDTILGRPVQIGRLVDKAVILAESGIGMTNAAMTTQKLIDTFHPKAIIFSGIAGAVDTSIRIGDIVACELGSSMILAISVRTVSGKASGYSTPRVTASRRCCSIRPTAPCIVWRKAWRRQSGVCAHRRPDASIGGRRGRGKRQYVHRQQGEAALVVESISRPGSGYGIGGRSASQHGQWFAVHRLPVSLRFGRRFRVIHSK